MIILAHVGPPGILLQLRNFDVPLMVLVSGASFALAGMSQHYLPYVWRRAKRLLLPVWIFLTIYFLLNWLAETPLEKLDSKTIAESYLLTRGIGYVWIIRVFLLIALVAPWIAALSRKIESDGWYILCLAAALLAYEGLRLLLHAYANDGPAKAMSQIVFDIFPYSILFALGLRMAALKEKMVYGIMGAFLILFLWNCYRLYEQSGEFISTQRFKYPPSIYYLSYATFVSMLLWLVSRRAWDVLARAAWIKAFILFAAHNSIWIYLWHIPLVKLVNTGFAFKYLLVFAATGIITYVQVSLVERVLLPKTENELVRRNVRALLTG